jgi:hypothetical protein
VRTILLSKWVGLLTRLQKAIVGVWGIVGAAGEEKASELVLFSGKAHPTRKRMIATGHIPKETDMKQNLMESPLPIS